MATNWITSEKFRGVRWRLHKSRKHGATPDRYFAIRFQSAGERKEEGLGWASQGWTERKAGLEIDKLREAAKKGEGHVRLAEKRAAAMAQRKAEAARKETEARERITFAQVWRAYAPHAEADKTWRSWQREDSLHRLWIGPVLDSLPMKDIHPLHLERLKKNMLDAGKSAQRWPRKTGPRAKVDIQEPKEA